MTLASCTVKGSGSFVATRSARSKRGTGEPIAAGGTAIPTGGGSAATGVALQKTPGVRMIDAAMTVAGALAATTSADLPGTATDAAYLPSCMSTSSGGRDGRRCTLA